MTGRRPPATQGLLRSRTNSTELRRAIDSAVAVLAGAGIGSARFDAEELAAHLAGTERGRLALLDSLGGEFFERFGELVDARARGRPLQHLTGTVAFGPVTLHVGPGVFIPRPETEAMLEWAINQVLPARPVIVDACTGSGALAAALSRHWPRARVLGIDDSDAALAYARRNCDNTAVELLRADATAPQLLADLNGAVDLVVANPPYVPEGSPVEPIVAEHDPPHALYGGPDGTTVIAAVAAAAGRWLRPGGRFAVEHDETAASLTGALIGATGLFDDIVARPDFAGRPRFVTAVRGGSEGRQ